MIVLLSYFIFCFRLINRGNKTEKKKKSKTISKKIPKQNFTFVFQKILLNFLISLLLLQ